MTETQKPEFLQFDQKAMAIRFQPVPNSPLPGEVIASLSRGEVPYTPSITMDDVQSGKHTYDEPQLKEWLTAHLQTFLGALPALNVKAMEHDYFNNLFLALYEQFGVVPRGPYQTVLKGLEEEKRQILREIGIRTGPLMVIMPDLLKPAPMHLRLSLYALWTGKDQSSLFLPGDGVVSVTKPETGVDEAYLQVAGYLVLGNRIARIDMVERVVNQIYDTAEQGKFRAQHNMAEWLGCPIEDLYIVLEALGHKRIVTQEVEEVETPEKTEEKTEETAVSDTEDKPAVKPVLDEFILKKGLAHARGAPNSPKSKPQNNQNKKPFTKKSIKKQPGGKHDKSSKKYGDAAPLKHNPFAGLKDISV